MNLSVSGTGWTKNITSEDVTRRQRFCSWHRILVEAGAAEGKCPRGCLLDCLDSEGKNYRNPDHVIIKDGISAGDLIRQVGYVRWETIRDLPAFIAELVDHEQEIKQGAARYLEELEVTL